MVGAVEGGNMMCCRGVRKGRRGVILQAMDWREGIGVVGWDVRCGR